MNRYVKIRFNDILFPNYFHYVDENYQWSEEQIKSENAKSVGIAKMAFLDHGTPMIPIDNMSIVMNQKAAYLTASKEITFLISEGGTFMTMLPEMAIVEEILCEYFPIEEGAAIVCENDPYDKWRGGLDHFFLRMAKFGGAERFHYMHSFCSRTESEIIDAFKKTPAIVFSSSHTDADWWELMIRCIIKSKTNARIIGCRYSGDVGKRFDLCVDFAKRFDVNVEVYQK